MHTICANVRRPSQFVCRVGCAHRQTTKLQEYRCWFVRVRESLGESVDMLCVEALGSAHRSSPPISHVIRWSDKLTTLRKPQNSNDVDSKFERVAGELRAKLRWGSGAPSGFGVPGFRGVRVSGCMGSGRNRSYKPTALRRRAARVSGRRTLRGVGHRHRMITILIHIHVRST